MAEQLIEGLEISNLSAVAETTSSSLGRVTILEALAEETSAISVDALGRCTPAGNGVDFDD